MERLDSFVDEQWEEEEEQAFDEFWGRYIDREEDLPPELGQMSRDVQETWFAFDYTLDDDSRIIDHFLRRADLRPGERSFLTAMRGSSMRFYEVVDTVPGTSMTLRDLVEGTVVKVNERSGSRTIARRECLAARVIPRGCSGGPEMEAGLLHIPRRLRDPVLAAVTRHRAEFFRDRPAGHLDDFYKEMPTLFHEVWAMAIFEPAVPELRNTDGEELIVTRVCFSNADARSAGVWASPQTTAPAGAPQHFLNFFPLPHGQGSLGRAFLPISRILSTCVAAEDSVAILVLAALRPVT